MPSTENEFFKVSCFIFIIEQLLFLEKFGESREINLSTSELHSVDSGITDESLTVADIIGDSGLGAELIVIADVDMTGEATLATDAIERSDLGRTGDAGLSCEYVRLADLDIVGHLNKIIEFGTTADDSRTESGTIDSGVGAHLDIIGENDITDLSYFLIRAVGEGGESESIGADHSAAMDDAARTDYTTLINFDTGTNHCIISDHRIIADINLGINLYILAERNILADISESADICILRDHYPISDKSVLLDADRLRFLGFKSSEERSDSDEGRRRESE